MFGFFVVFSSCCVWHCTIHSTQKNFRSGGLEFIPESVGRSSPLPTFPKNKKNPEDNPIEKQIRKVIHHDSSKGSGSNSILFLKDFRFIQVFPQQNRHAVRIFGIQIHAYNGALGNWQIETTSIHTSASCQKTTVFLGTSGNPPFAICLGLHSR